MPGLPEVWLRGPVAGVPALLQPVAHALLQAREEVGHALESFPDSLLWTRPGGMASVGFHLQHLVGVLDRLFTYARGEQLSDEQLAALKREGRPHETDDSTRALVRNFQIAVERAIENLATFDGAALTEAREVGRARLPSTGLGLTREAVARLLMV